MPFVQCDHKFYYCRKKGNSFVCNYAIKNANFWLPRSFIWHDAQDMNGLRAYIDALTFNNKTVTSLWEEKRMATDHVYEPEPEGGVVRLDALKLMAFLRGEYVLEVPAKGRIVLSDKGGKPTYMPLEAHVALVNDPQLVHDYIARLRELVNTNKPILCVTREQIKDAKSKALEVDVWNPFCNVTGTHEFPQVNSLTSDAPASHSFASNFKENTAPEQEDKEVEVSRVAHDSYLEINYTTKHYFTRRYFLKDGAPFYGASSYDGIKWTVFFVEQTIYDTIFAAECAP